MWWQTLVCLGVVNIAGAKISRVVKLEQGLVRGYKNSDADIFSFYGIPYATGPTGPNKFKPPQSPPTWKETFEAVDKGIICPQIDLSGIPADKVMQEDCLIANIFVPNTNNKNLPVFVIVHGGGYQSGYGNWISAKNLMRTKDMIIVSFNYRLGKHGFLCLGTKYAPGNAGLKDQVALLRWVNKNIAAFGGNPDDVTLGGFSAGGSSVELLLLSETSKGLFNKVIPESSYSLGAFSMQPNPLEVAKTFAMRLNFTDTNDLHALEEFYKSMPLDLLLRDGLLTDIDNSIFFSPCIEHDFGDEVFLNKDPITSLKSGKYQKVPMLLGFNSMEGLQWIDFFDRWGNGMNKNFADYLPPDLKFNNESQKNEFAKQIKEFYFNNQLVNNNNILSYVDYISDVFYTIPALRSLKLHLDNGHNAIYLYEYTFADENTPFVPHTNTRGATHTAQTKAIFDGTDFYQPDESHITPQLKKVKSMMRELWSNFITTGKPVPDTSELPSWPPVRSDGTPYMSLGEKFELKGALLERRFRFWEDIYRKNYRMPIPPSIL